ncbi:MAG: hypothetical protein JXA30_01550 [Deltaproteobacteria bacterium]|nr:hypothetical protein [Deltaproteobacteria bacterium]
MKQPESVDGATVSRPFLLAFGFIACSVLGLYIWIASIDWFAGDDFAFLFYVQQPWDWLKVFFPLEHSFWWTYRPLGMDSYFYLAFKLFGWNAQGFFAITIVTHILTAAAVFRLARQLDFEVRSAAVASLIAVSRFPSITNLTLACCFHHVAALFFLVLALSLFLDYARNPKRVFQIAAWAVFFLGLLCNEFVLSLPFLVLLASLYVDRFSFSRSAFLRAVIRVWPFFVIAGLFSLYRYGAIASQETPSYYRFFFSPHIFGNAVTHFIILAGSRNALFSALSILALIAIALAWNKKTSGRIWSKLAARHALILPWLCGMAAVLGALPFAHVRLAMTLQIPAALLFAAWLDAFLETNRTKYQRVLEIAIVALLLLSLPWSQVVARAAVPKGVWMRNFQRVVMTTLPDMPESTLISVLYGGPGQAKKAAADEFSALGYGPAVIRSRYPDKEIDIRYLDMTRAAPRNIWCWGCVYFELLPSMQVEPITTEQLQRLLSSGDSERSLQSFP